jgi:hypothetical protein
VKQVEFSGTKRGNIRKKKLLSLKQKVGKKYHLSNGYRGLFLCFFPGGEADHSPPSSADVLS